MMQKQYRVWANVNGLNLVTPVPDVQTAVHVLWALFQDWARPDFDNVTGFNAHGLEEYDPEFEDNDGWCEWYSPMGEDISSYLRDDEGRRDIGDILKVLAEDDVVLTHGKFDHCNRLKVEQGEFEYKVTLSTGKEFSIHEDRLENELYIKSNDRLLFSPQSSNICKVGTHEVER